MGKMLCNDPARVSHESGISLTQPFSRIFLGTLMAKNNFEIQSNLENEVDAKDCFSFQTLYLRPFYQQFYHNFLHVTNSRIILIVHGQHD